MTTLLTTSEVAQALALPELSGWEGDPKGIVRTVKAPDFLAGIRLVDAVADAAEAADHHPDIDIRWRTVTFLLVTHSEGGVTRRDLGLAKEINALAERAGCQ